MISMTARYALNAVVYMARGDSRPVPAAAVAEALDVPANYLSKILRDLARVGVLTSDRGRNGGFRLARPADAIRLVEVVEPFDGLGARGQCLLGRGACSDVGGCPAHMAWKEASGPLVRFFETRTVGDLGHMR